MDRIRILVVEDEQVIAENIVFMLEKLGYSPAGKISSGEEAIKKIMEDPPDLVLMDIVLKGETDGFSAAEQIIDRYHIPVVYLTAYADEGTLQRAKLTAPFGYILKPCREKELQTAIEIALYRHKAEEKLRRYTNRLEAMREIDKAILEANSPYNIARAILADIKNMVPCTIAVIFSFNPEKEEARLLASSNDIVTAIKESETVSLKYFQTVYGLGQGETLYIEDLANEERVYPELQCMGVEDIQSLLMMPLVAEKNLIGTLIIGNIQPSAFSREHQAIALETSNHLAVAMHQVSLRNNLEEERHRLENLVEQLPHGVVFVDREQRIILANRLARAYLQVLRGPKIGETLKHLGGIKLKELIKRTADNRLVEIEKEDPDRRVFVLGAGKLEGEESSGAYILTIRDITQERDMDKQLKQHERLAALGQLAAGIAHDFNNMLQSIMMSAELLLRHEDLPANLAQKLDNIIQQGERGGTLIHQILDFSRKSVNTRQRLNLTPFIKEIVKILSRTIPENINIITEIEPDDLMIDADATQIQQIITNLVLNARDAMPNGGELCISLCRTLNKPGLPVPTVKTLQGRWICLSVIDIGTGISPEIQPYIFDPFYSTKDEQQGSGLGLSQVYGIVRGHGGYINFTSEEGGGTAFHVFLPELEKEHAKDKKKSADSKIMRGQGELILLAEDDPVNLKIAAESLEYLGYRVCSAADGAEALDLYNRCQVKPDIVLADVVMPKVSGLELCGKIRKKDKKIKLILMSGYQTIDLEGSRKIDGISAWISKPLSLHKLAPILRQAIEE